jgi:hypothetical protein
VLITAPATGPTVRVRNVVRASGSRVIRLPPLSHLPH